MIGSCHTVFLSGDDQANVVGATANLLLVINEAQDILPAVYREKIRPHGRQPQCHPRVSAARPGLPPTLLAQMARLAASAEKADGLTRVLLYRRAGPPGEPGFRGIRGCPGQPAGPQSPIGQDAVFCEEIDAEVACSHPGVRQC